MSGEKNEAADPNEQNREDSEFMNEDNEEMTLTSNEDSKDATGNSNSTTKMTSSDKTGVANPSGIDAHPYARGSVIEVLYIVDPRRNDSDDDYSEEEGEPEYEPKHLQASEARLADIIDRANSNTPDHPNPAYRYKYYIHYRDQNRRMDEWITDPERILNPPSVGNAKVRALKKAAKEEHDKKMKEKEKRELEALVESLDDKRRKLDGDLTDGAVSPFGRPVSQRASSRRASAAITSALTYPNNTQATSTPEASNLSVDVGEEQSRLTRNRRKSSRPNLDEADSGSDEKKDDLSSTPSTVVHTLLPEYGNIKDKVVTVAAQELDEHEGLDEASLREHEEVTKVKNVKEVELGKYNMDTWYYSPLPKELMNKDGSMIEVLYVCEFTMQFFTRKKELLRFQAKHLKAGKRHPPGNEIYRNGNISMFEIDGLEEKIYCQNLCYIAKLFLDHKTLYFDVDPFLFYVLCEVDDRGFHPVGYFSKEKYSDVGYNLACILTFPCHQRKGYGRLLIDFSYELSKKEEKVGSPEKPMSDLGQQAYKPYWTSTIVDFLANQSNEKSLSIMDISKRTSIMAEDVIFTLNLLGLLKYVNGVYFITAERDLLKELAKKHPIKEPRVHPDKLHWTPFLTEVKRDKFSIHCKKPSIEDNTKQNEDITQ